MLNDLVKEKYIKICLEVNLILQNIKIFAVDILKSCKKTSQKQAFRHKIPLSPTC